MDLPPLLLDDEIAGKASIATSSFLKVGTVGTAMKDPAGTEDGTIGATAVDADIFARSL